ncbi:hypothetical protein GUITHDRAFT_111802 [Guillardia theta CCMP2712]|uniref:Uncharacterized protein n=1 Tax=Guillardia theta (strain CCMP2712) TaxID=905079 RepID=L1J143_GUITC|nr:hypothetical protein GUITHDRAFT_111802 [Guillardia theta CCMP2712]EKX42241.1 hypothetical protein GUITHDRAFT_111802 [Guillardia theta CCMP2712]|eukprot:XP_005829221.1 hypothetical protein GUITHDRAFT_111802 [Guillardia theta CCMP2712]
MYSVALFKTSVSYENVKASGEMLLQLLSKEQVQAARSNLVETLGRKSARDVDKLEEAMKLGYQVGYHDDIPFIEESLFVCKLQVSSCPPKKPPKGDKLGINVLARRIRRPMCFIWLMQ